MDIPLSVQLQSLSFSLHLSITLLQLWFPSGMQLLMPLDTTPSGTYILCPVILGDMECLATLVIGACTPSGDNVPPQWGMFCSSRLYVSLGCNPPPIFSWTGVVSRHPFGCRDSTLLGVCFYASRDYMHLEAIS